ncbi:YdcF family protein [Ruegeria sp. ANG-R]|uniref:YdcF family protein n=1 Tax=Ruegeria sp. ANG-R TaxID=1577903 RepID=UPI00187CDB42|nr:YdcF family protein [Ruegeria sp. ANG-R]
MDADANLGSESRARLERAAALHHESPFDLFLTSGWAYREDCTQKIGAVMADELQTTYAIDRSKIVVDTNSRDTVGDAYFLRRNAIIPMRIRDLVVVTSDYHVERTGFIFRSFFPTGVELKVVGAVSGSLGDEAVLLNEQKSLTAFEKTFATVDFADDRQVCKALSTKHPFYNGQIYDQIRCST